MFASVACCMSNFFFFFVKSNIHYLDIFAELEKTFAEWLSKDLQNDISEQLKQNILSVFLH